MALSLRQIHFKALHSSNSSTKQAQTCARQSYTTKMSKSEASARMNEIWQNDEGIAQSYTVGERLTGPPALEMFRKSGVLDAQPPVEILDNACGTGIITHLLLQRFVKEQNRDDFNIVAADFSPAMVKQVTERIEKDGWKNVKPVQADMMDMSAFADESFTHHLTNFGVMFPPEADKTVSEAKRLLKPGGVLAFTTWQRAGWIDIFREVAKRIPGAPAVPSNDALFEKIQTGNKWHTVPFIEGILAKHGFEDVDVKPFPALQKLTPKEYVTTFGGPLARSISSVFWSDEEIATYFDKVPAATEQYIKDQRWDVVELPMTAIVSVARKPKV